MAGKLLAMKGKHVTEGKQYNFSYSLGIWLCTGRE